MSSVADTHRRVHGRDPDGVWSAPGRVNLVGEHTDYNDGLVLPIALPLRTTAACSRRKDSLVRVHSAQNGETAEVSLDEVAPGTPRGWSAYVAGVPWALRRKGYSVGGLDVTVDSEVPLGAGLSSSAALECAVGAAASDLYGLRLLATDRGRALLANACVHAENEVAGAPTGGMDQSAALLCRQGRALLLDCRDGATEQVPFDLAATGHVLLVTDTRASHALADGQYGNRRAECERAAAVLGVATLREVHLDDLDAALRHLGDPVLVRRTRHVVTEIARVRAVVAALRDDDLATVGRLFDASHESLRRDYEVSCPELDASVEAAREAGALGARMTGGGFGGSSIAIVPEDGVERVRRAIRDAFGFMGWREPRSIEVTASGPARRDA